MSGCGRCGRDVPESERYTHYCGVLAERDELLEIVQAALAAGMAVLLPKTPEAVKASLLAIVDERDRLRAALLGIANDRQRTAAGLQGWAREALRIREDAA